jgi:hypothetical protein
MTFFGGFLAGVLFCLAVAAIGGIVIVDRALKSVDQ